MHKYASIPSLKERKVYKDGLKPIVLSHLEERDRESDYTEPSV